MTLIGCGTATQKAVVVSQCRVLDLAAQGSKRVEAVPGDVLDECLAKLDAIAAR